jgi:hypothetical protein
VTNRLRIAILIAANMPAYPNRIAVALLTLFLVCGCGRPPAETAANSNSQKLPFDRQPRSDGVSPSQTLIPSTTKLPEGTPIPVRLQSPLSSASAHAGDSFTAAIDEPVVIDGRTLVVRGTPTTGRVLEAKPAERPHVNLREKAVGSSVDSSLDSSLGSSPGSSLEPGYLRIVLVSLNVGGKTVMIETSSIFIKGRSREEQKSAAGAASGDSPKDKNAVVGVDRRLNFRLAQTVDLQ